MMARSKFSHLRFMPHMPDDLIWKQYGVNLVHLPPEEQERRILQISNSLYRDYIRGRLDQLKPPATTSEPL